MTEQNQSNKDGAVAVVRMRASELRKRARAARHSETEIIEHDQGSSHPHCVLPPYFFDRALHALENREDRRDVMMQSE